MQQIANATAEITAACKCISVRLLGFASSACATCAAHVALVAHAALAFARFSLHWLPPLRIAMRRSYACALRIAYRVSRSRTAYPYPSRVPARVTHTLLSIPMHPLKSQSPQRFLRICNRLSSSPVAIALLQRVAYTLAGGDMLRSDPRRAAGNSQQPSELVG